jgi:hypothetical protein
VQRDVKAALSGGTTAPLEHVRRGVEPLDVEPRGDEVEERVAVTAAELKGGLADPTHEALVRTRIDLR